MSAKSRMLAKLKRMGGFIHTDTDDISAGVGMVFRSTGTHDIPIIFDGASRKEVWDSLFDDLAYGVEPCADPHCDCHTYICPCQQKEKK